MIGLHHHPGLHDAVLRLPVRRHLGVALVLNGLLIIAAMSMTQATLTLPGIAGLILTFAVAVDANVLIYERMRDEARAGRSVIASMDAGFNKAMGTILDANLTTLVAALIMFIFGAGPVRGFAWTLTHRGVHLDAVGRAGGPGRCSPTG
jgi:protein-export membrane protein SecD